MKSTLTLRGAAAFLCLGLFVALAPAAPNDPPAPAKLSTVAPAADLVATVKLLSKEITEGVADESAYLENKDNHKMNANTLVVLAQAIGLHDEETDMKKSAPALFAAAKSLASAGDFAAAKAAAEAVTAAVEGRATEGPELKWERAASMGQVMKQVTAVNNRLRRGLRRLESKKDDIAREAALLAAIAQAVTFDTHEVKDQSQIGKWYELCGEFRDAAGELNAKARAADKKGAEAAVDRVAKSCDDCHAAFRVEVKKE